MGMINILPSNYSDRMYPENKYGYWIPKNDGLKRVNIHSNMAILWYLPSLKEDGWNTTFLLGRLIFRGYVSFREGMFEFLRCTE